MALYYGNIWNAQDFPFLSQELFNITGANATNLLPYNQTLILNPDNTINDAAVQFYGAPWLTASKEITSLNLHPLISITLTFMYSDTSRDITIWSSSSLHTKQLTPIPLGYVFSLITTNAGFTGCFVHMFLWNYAEIKTGWSFLTLTKVKETLSLASLKYFLRPSTYFFWRNQGKRTQEEKQVFLDDPEIDPHYKVMIQNDYDECPSSWYFFAWLASFITVMTCLYVIKSTLPWWGIVFAQIVLWLLMLFFGAQYAITGFQFNVSNVMQTIAGYCFPRAPVG
jgi:hypothetical protein